MDNSTGDLFMIGMMDVEQHKKNVDDGKGYIKLYWSGT